MERRFQFTAIVAVIWFLLAFLAVEAWFSTQKTAQAAAASSGTKPVSQTASHRTSVGPSGAGPAVSGSSGGASSASGKASSSAVSLAQPDTLLSLEPRPEGIDPNGIIALRVVDISHHNTVTDWAALKGYADGLYLKATEGSQFTDPMVDKYAKGAAKMGIPFGFYHYFQPSASTKYVKAQADHFYSTIKKYSYKFVPVLDIEEVNGLTESQMISSVKVFLKEFKKVANQRLMFYCSPAFANEHLSDKSFSAYPLWIANYNVNAPRRAMVWSAFDVWQYNTGIPVPGLDGQVDCNIATEDIFLNKDEIPKQ